MNGMEKIPETDQSDYTSLFDIEISLNIKTDFLTIVRKQMDGDHSHAMEC